MVEPLIILLRDRFRFPKNSTVLQLAESMKNTNGDERLFIFFINDKSDKHNQKKNNVRLYDY